MRPSLWWIGSWLTTKYSQETMVTRSLQATSSWTLDDARLLVQEASCSQVDSSLEGALVHLTCPVQYAQPLGEDDPLLRGIPSEDRMGYRLEARMRVFQWEEQAYTKKVGKKNVRDFFYWREWYDQTPPANTTFFGSGRECSVKNGGRPCYQWNPAEVESWWNESGYQLGWQTLEIAQSVSAGAYSIPDYVLQNETFLYPQLLTPACESEGDNNQQEDRPLPCALGNGMAHLVEEDSVVAWQQLDSNGTVIDYLTRLYQMALMDTISVLAVQRGNSFVPWPENATQPLLFEFVPNTASAAQMIESAQSSAVISRKVGVGVWMVAGSFGAVVLALVLCQ